MLYSRACCIRGRGRLYVVLNSNPLLSVNSVVVFPSNLPHSQGTSTQTCVFPSNLPHSQGTSTQTCGFPIQPTSLPGHLNTNLWLSHPTSPHHKLCSTSPHSLLAKVVWLIKIGSVHVPSWSRSNHSIKLVERHL